MQRQTYERKTERERNKTNQKGKQTQRQTDERAREREVFDTRVPGCASRSRYHIMSVSYNII